MWDPSSRGTTRLPHRFSSDTASVAAGQKQVLENPNPEGEFP
jgi:hypothetical protein